ncbi:rhoGAP domain-containing protein [Phthorimaea operculella]|nr:rhoGAP domain-containing protein [Phthorimaea operculella]
MFQEGVTGEWRGAWVMLVRRVLVYCSGADGAVSLVDLRKTRCVVTQESDEDSKLVTGVDCSNLLLDCPHATLYLRFPHERELKGWRYMVKLAAHNNGAHIHHQQLTKDDVPAVVDKCLSFIYAHGSLSEGIYRRAGSSSVLTELLARFRRDAWAVQLAPGAHSEHDVAGVLKRFFRDLPEPLLPQDLHQPLLHALMSVAHQCVASTSTTWPACSSASSGTCPSRCCPRTCTSRSCTRSVSVAHQCVASTSTTWPACSSASSGTCPSRCCPRTCTSRSCTRSVSVAHQCVDSTSTTWPACSSASSGTCPSRCCPRTCTSRSCTRSVSVAHQCVASTSTTWPACSSASSGTCPSRCCPRTCTSRSCTRSVSVAHQCVASTSTTWPACSSASSGTCPSRCCPRTCTSRSCTRSVSVAHQCVASTSTTWPACSSASSGTCPSRCCPRTCTSRSCTRSYEHDVAGVLKRFFRDLPEPLLPQDLHQPLLHALMLEDEPARHAEFRRIMTSLPLVARNTARKLFAHLHFLSTLAEVNKMGADNLAAVWAPTVMPAALTSNSLQAAWSSKEVYVVRELIASYEAVWEPTEVETRREAAIRRILMRVLSNQAPSAPRAAGDLRAWVYVHDRNTCYQVALTPSKTAGEVCVELCQKAGLESHQLMVEEVVLAGALRRAVHVDEPLLQVVLRWGYWDDADRRDNYLLVR